MPLIWVAPKLAKAGSKCEQAVDLMSIYPTLCELAGGAGAQACRGSEHQAAAG